MATTIKISEGHERKRDSYLNRVLFRRPIKRGTRFPPTLRGIGRIQSCENRINQYAERVTLVSSRELSI